MSPVDLHGLEAHDLLFLGSPPFALELSAIFPTNALVFVHHSDLLHDLVNLGWRALLVPSLESSLVRVALSAPGELIRVEMGTLVLSRSEVWTDEGAQRLSPRCLLALAHLVGSSDRFVMREELNEVFGLAAASRAPDRAIWQLRRLIGPRNLLNRAGDGWRFVATAQPTAQPVRISRSLPTQIGDVVLDLEAQIAQRGREEIPLTRNESLLLTKLVQSGTAARRELSRTIWGTSDSTRKLDMLVSRVRKKLGPHIIRTLRGAGYGLGNLSEHAQVKLAQADAITELRAKLRSHPWITLTGPPGLGQEALARAVAALEGAPIVEAGGLAVARLLRHLGREGPLVVVGLLDAQSVQEALISRGCWTLLVAQAEAGVCQETVVKRCAPEQEGSLLERAESWDSSAIALTMRFHDGKVREQLARLTAFAGHFTATDAAALGVEDLNELVRYHLITAPPHRLLAPLRELLGVHPSTREAHRSWVLAFAADVLDRPGFTLVRARRALQEVEEALPHAEADDAGWLQVHLCRLRIALGLPPDASALAQRARGVSEPLRSLLWLTYAEAERHDFQGIMGALNRVASKQLMGRVLLRRAHRYGRAGELDKCRAVLDQLEAALPEVGWPDLCRLKALRLRAVLAQDPDQKTQILISALQALEEARWRRGSELATGALLELTERARVLGTLAVALNRAGRQDEAEMAYERTLAVTGASEVNRWVRMNYAGFLMGRGNNQRAEEVLAEVSRRTNEPEMDAYLVGLQGLLHLQRGDLEGALRIAAVMEQLAQANHFSAAPAVQLRCMVAALREEPEPVLAYLKDEVERDSEIGTLLLPLLRRDWPTLHQLFDKHPGLTVAALRGAIACLPQHKG